MHKQLERMCFDSTCRSGVTCVCAPRELLTAAGEEESYAGKLHGNLQQLRFEKKYSLITITIGRDKIR